MQWKLRLVRRLYERGYARQDVLELFRFIDWVLTLPSGLEARVQAELVQLEGERQMPYITSFERIGIEKGIQQGEVIVLKRQLTRRFGPLPEWAEQRLEQASLRELEGWADRVLEAQSSKTSLRRSPLAAHAEALLARRGKGRAEAMLVARRKTYDNHGDRDSADAAC